MNRFEIFKFFHVLSAVVWIGAGVSLTVLSMRLRAAGERATIIAVGGQTESLGKMLFMPAALGTLLFGVLMVATDPRFAFSDLWILIGFAAVAASFVVGVVMLTPADKKLAALVTEHGVDHPDVDNQLVKILRLSGVDVLILVIAVWAMVAKPML